jgi:1,2-diacylglycerol 3-beta-glucosyltransferase
MVQVLAWVATIGIVSLFIHAVRLWFVSRDAAVPAGRPGIADEYFFAFLVPALNEERVIQRTLDRLLDLPEPHKLVLVIDDGSTDATGELVRDYADQRVRLLRRDLPRAQQGKGAALNAGLERLAMEVAGWPAEKVIVCIMDADGRLDRTAPELVAAYFADPAVGAVQISVRIGNRRDNMLARLQDVEFVTYTDVYQSARDRWGVAGLGGNGQFVRLAALYDLAPIPWTAGLTEDLEQGLRLVCAGWRTRYCRSAAVHQQGLISGRRLLRQRSRWFQGHLQAWRQIPAILRHAPLRTVPHLLHYLLAPALILANALLTAALAAMVVALVVSPSERLALAHRSTGIAWYWLTFAFAVFLTVSVYAQREPGMSRWRLLGVGHLFALYALLWMAAGYWALSRILAGKQGWFKSERLAERHTQPAVAERLVSADAP